MKLDSSGNNNRCVYSGKRRGGGVSKGAATLRTSLEWAARGEQEHTDSFRTTLEWATRGEQKHTLPLEPLQSGLPAGGCC